MAEIADKPPDFVETLALGGALTCVVVGLARVRWWCAIVALPLFGAWNWAEYQQLQESDFGPLIWREMGTAYVLWRFVALNAPPVVGLWVAMRCRRLWHHSGAGRSSKR